MSVFITGATGFVGRNLLFWLLKHQPDVKIIGLSRDRARAETLLTHPRVQWIEGDLNAPNTYRATLREAEMIVHAGALVKLRNGPEFYPQNVDATRHLVQAAQDAANLQRFVFLGSVSAYDRGWNAAGYAVIDGPLSEASYPKPRTDYGKSKLAAQQMVEGSGLPYAVAVPAYIYGPYPRSQSSMDRLIQDVAQDVPYTGIPFPGRASEIYSEDLAEILWLLATHPAAKNEVFFTANPQPVEISRAFATVSRALGKPYRPRAVTSGQLSRLQSYLYTREPDNAMLRILFEDAFWCCADKLATRLNYRPRYGFEEGVARTVSWYRKQGLLA